MDWVRVPRETDHPLKGQTYTMAVVTSMLYPEDACLDYIYALYLIGGQEVCCSIKYLSPSLLPLLACLHRRHSGRRDAGFGCGIIVGHLETKYICLSQDLEHGPSFKRVCGLS